LLTAALLSKRVFQPELYPKFRVESGTRAAALLSQVSTKGGTCSEKADRFLIQPKFGAAREVSREKFEQLLRM